MIKSERASINKALRKAGHRHYELEKILLKFARQITRAALKMVIVDSKISPRSSKQEDEDFDKFLGETERKIHELWREK